VGLGRPPLPSPGRDNPMKILIGAIAIFGIGYALNDLTDIKSLIVVAACLAATVIILVVNDKRKTK
jgi:hypothetical protein